MSLAPAQCRVEIFRGPILFDDHFCRNWTKTSGGDSVFFSQGDIVIIDAASQATCDIERTIPDTVVSAPLEWRVISRTTVIAGGIFEIWVYNKTTSSWVRLKQVTVAGLDQGTLQAISAGDTISKIRLRANGQYCSVSMDYFALTQHPLQVPDLGDIVDEFTVTSQILNVGINGATVVIPNFSGAYNGLINLQDAILIWLARDTNLLGLVTNKVFGGRIVSYTNRDEKYGETYIVIECHGHAYELAVPPQLLQALYAGVNGRTIIEDAINLCNYIARHPNNENWFDAAGASGYGNTNDWIASTHDICYDEEKPLAVIQEILEKTKNPAAVQGFDAYETSAGCIVGHLRNSLDFTSPITSITPKSYQKKEDLHRVRNKIKVYGVKDHANPSDKDGWTDSTAGWTIGSGALYVNGVTKVIGSYSLSLQGDNCWMYRTFTAISGGKMFESSYEFLIFWTGEDNGKEIEVRLFAPDSSNYFSRKISSVYKWTQQKWGLGPEYDLEWSKTGSPNWNDIQGFRIGVNGTSNVTLWLDGLHFYPNRYSYTAEDSESEAKYGTRLSKLEVDEALKTNAECQARAESILAVFKDPVITLSDIVVDGDNGYNPGDRQRVIVSNDGLDAYFRIIQVEHSVKGTQWDTILTLSNEPQYIDYVFKLLQEVQKLLERRG